MWIYQIKKHIKTPYNSCWIWKGLLESADTIFDNTEWKVGNANDIPPNHLLWWPMQSRSPTLSDIDKVHYLILRLIKGLCLHLHLI